MNPIRLEFRGLTRFRRTVVIDFDRLPDGLIAVAGGNGEGKTTTLEAMIVAVYGTFPTRPGSVYDYLQPPLPGEVDREPGEGGRSRKPADAVVDFSVDLDGARWRFLRKFDSVARSQTCQVWIDGVARGEGKVEEAAALVAARWPPLSQLLASVFAAQGGEGSFLSLKPAARKDLIVRLLGLERLQELAVAASKEAAVAVDRRERAGEALARATESAERLQRARDELKRTRQVREAAEAAEAEAAAANAEIVRERNDAREAMTAANADRNAQGVKVAELADAAAAAERAMDAAAAALRAASDAAGEVDDLRARAAGLDNLRDAFAAATERRAAAYREHADAVAARDRAAEKHDTARRYRTKLEAEEASLPTADVDACEARAKQEAEALVLAATKRAEVGQLRVKVDKAIIRKHEEARAREAVAGAARRASLLADVPCGGRVMLRTDDDPIMTSATEVDCSGCPLLTDAVRARDSLPLLHDDLEDLDGAERELAEIADELAEAEAAARTAQEQATDLRGAVARLEQARASAARLAALRDELAEARLVEDAAREAFEVARGRAAMLADEIPDAPNRGPLEAAVVANARLAEVAPLAGAVDARREAREAAAVACESLNADLAFARDAHMALTDAAALAIAAYERTSGAATTAAEAARAAARALQDASAANARAVGAVEALEHADGKVDEARAALVSADQEAEDAALLAQVLGRDGVQAMELDAVGPAVSSIATEILRVVYGPRFVVQFVTQVLKAGAAGKKGETREVFDVRVIDDERGTDGPAERLSGGEQVVVSEALKLALAVFASQTGSSRLRTLVRDESDGALDDDRAANYPAMLRRAQELGGFRRVLLVSHRPATVAACDAALHVAQGGVEIVL